jgi:hypothetical protein
MSEKRDRQCKKDGGETEKCWPYLTAGIDLDGDGSFMNLHILLYE